MVVVLDQLNFMYSSLPLVCCLIGSSSLFDKNALDHLRKITLLARLVSCKYQHAFFKDHPIPLPPLAEQRCIIAAIEEQFTQLDAGVAALKAAQVKLRCYRVSVLKAACEGAGAARPARRTGIHTARTHPGRAPRQVGS